MWSNVDSGACGPAPCGRGKHAAAVLGGLVYVTGGRGAGGAVPLRDLWRYCLATGEWQKLECKGDPPPALQEHSMTAYENRLYVFGGEAGSLSNETPLWIYDTETGFWRKLPGQCSYSASTRRRGAKDAKCGPRGRRGHSAHALKDCLLVYGGYKDLRGSTNELWAFHYESESWQQVRAAAGPARHRHAAAVLGARLYVHGGQSDLRACADLWHYDTVSREWTAVRAASKQAPSARSGHAAVRAGAHLYIYGGETAAGACDELWRFHFASECWERVCAGAAGPPPAGPPPAWPSPRVDAAALLVRRPDAPPAAALYSREHEVSRVSSGRWRLSLSRPLRRARGDYSALAARDSTDSLERHDAALAKSRSAHVIEMFQSLIPLPREQVSVPDLCGRRTERDQRDDIELTTFGEYPADDSELSTSDYASAERVHRLSGFSNPHYLGPDVRALAALTPDSGAPDDGPARPDAQLSRPVTAPSRPDPDLCRPDAARCRLHLLLLGGKEPPHPARLQSPISLWTYLLL